MSECMYGLSIEQEFGRDDYGSWMTFAVGNVQVKLRWIPPGTFLMGSPEDDEEAYSDERPQHPVTLGRGYFLAETPCTQALWQGLMGDSPSHFKGDDRPVERVSWDDCQRFIQTLNERVPGLEARLPTEAEWEYACRAGTTGARYAEDLSDIAWYNANSGNETHPVEGKQANAFGLYDMLGNVWEWCSDYWADTYEAGPVTDPSGPVEPPKVRSRVIRGGSWISNARFVRAAYRSHYTPGYRSRHLGFRLARGPSGQPSSK